VAFLPGGSGVFYLALILQGKKKSHWEVGEMFMMIILAAVVVSLPLVGIVLVSVASRREDAAYSLGGPARSQLQLAARRLVDFSSEAASLPVPKSLGYVGAVRPALAVVEPLRNEALDSPRIAAASRFAVRSAA
jgi:hypothetical protein